MARTKTTSVETENVANATVEDVNTVALKAKIAEQEKQMAEMMAQMKLMMQAQAGVCMATEKKPNRNIKFINLSGGTLVLRGNRFHSIDGQFAVKQIPESEARAIISNMPNAINDGLCYIADADFVKEMELDGLYQDILSDTQLKTLLDKNADKVCEIYRNASDAQKHIIVDMVEGRKLNGLSVDANIVVELSKLCGKDLMAIEPDTDE